MLKRHRTLSGIIPFNSCHFWLIKNVAEFKHRPVILASESESLTAFPKSRRALWWATFSFSLAISTILHSITLSVLPLCEVWVTLVREPCNARSAQMRTRLTLTQLAPFSCHFFLHLTPKKKKKKITINKKSEAQWLFFLHECCRSHMWYSAEGKQKCTQFTLPQFWSIYLWTLEWENSASLLVLETNGKAVESQGSAENQE